MDAETVEDVAKIFSANWAFIEEARKVSDEQLVKVEHACRALVVPDTSLVVFGSLA